MSKKIVAANKLGINRDLLDPDALEVVQRLHDAGFAAYIVGGGIRDLLLGKKPKDYDIVTDAVPEKIRRVFGRNSLIIGRRFKIVHVYFERLNLERSAKHGRNCYERHVIDVSTYRSNLVHDHLLSEHGRILVDNNYGTIDEDAFRRDFSVNALYYDPIAEKIIDYHNGLEDIKNRLLRVIGNAHERYLEDPVRVLRAIRLSEKLDLNIAEDTYINFLYARNLLVNEPRGRLFEEMLKILMSGHATKIIAELAELNLPRRVFPLFDKLFFQSPSNEFAWKVLKKTDLRVTEGGDVSLAFILAGLGWPAVYATWQQQQLSGLGLRPALLEAISANRMLLQNNGITRNLYAAMYDIWTMQLEFEYPNVLKLDQLLTHNRFRQAWHLFDLRNEFQQVEPQIYAWWARYMQASSSEHAEYLLELADIAPPAHKPAKRRRRRTTKVDTAI